MARNDEISSLYSTNRFLLSVPRAWPCGAIAFADRFAYAIGDTRLTRKAYENKLSIRWKKFGAAFRSPAILRSARCDRSPSFPRGSYKLFWAWGAANVSAIVKRALKVCPAIGRQGGKNRAGSLCEQTLSIHHGRFINDVMIRHSRTGARISLVRLERERKIEPDDFLAFICFSTLLAVSSSLNSREK